MYIVLRADRVFSVIVPYNPDISSDFISATKMKSLNELHTTIHFVSWNVRGLNERSKCLAVRQTILIENPDIICLQETKLSDLD